MVWWEMKNHMQDEDIYTLRTDPWNSHRVRVLRLMLLAAISTPKTWCHHIMSAEFVDESKQLIPSKTTTLPTLDIDRQHTPIGTSRISKAISQVHRLTKSQPPALPEPEAMVFGRLETTGFGQLNMIGHAMNLVVPAAVIELAISGARQSQDQPLQCRDHALISCSKERLEVSDLGV